MDPRMAEMMDPATMPCDGKRMIYGGIEMLVDLLRKRLNLVESSYTSGERSIAELPALKLVFLIPDVRNRKETKINSA